MGRVQAALLQLTQCGVLSHADKDAGREGPSTSVGPHAMPGAWVCAMMVVRSNHSARGHSAVTIPDIFVQRDGEKAPNNVATAFEALQAVGVNRANVGPKEGLGLVNGTATSTALAGLVMYETHQLAVLTQVLGTMAVEALMGN